MRHAVTNPALFRPHIPRAFRSLRRLTGYCVAPWLLAACVFHRSPRAAADRSAHVPPTAASAASPAGRAAAVEHRVGTVRVIGNGQRFVLIEVPPTGARRAARRPIAALLAPPRPRDAATTATLRVSRERRRPFVVADVVAGEPHVGDSRVPRSEPPPAPTGPTVLPTATAGVLPIVLPDPAP